MTKYRRRLRGRDQLRVSREAGQGKGAGGAEEAVAREQALKEAQSRIAELERTLKDLQRAVELKSQTGAQMQAQADATKGEGRGAGRRTDRHTGADHDCTATRCRCQSSGASQSRAAQG